MIKSNSPTTPLRKSLLFLLLLITSALANSKEITENDIFTAIYEQNLEEVAAILKQGEVELDPPKALHSNNKPLGYAAMFGTVEIVEAILKAGADIDGQMAYDDSPLIKAISNGNEEIALYLIEKGADVNLPNFFGISAFIGFAGMGRLDLVEHALKHGGNINASFNNYSALQVAVAFGHKEVVELLLAHGGDPSLKGTYGQDAFTIAKESGFYELLPLLERVK